MRVSVFMLAVIVIVAVLQVIATIMAIRLIRRTKYNVVWIMCIIGFCSIFAERLCQLISASGGTVRDNTVLIFGIITSLSISAAVLFAHTLTNYIDRIQRQRTLSNRRVMTAVLRAEERSRATFAKELHDGLGPLLSSAKMSLSAVRKDGMTKEQTELYNNTVYVVEEAIRSLREISNSMSPQMLNDFGLKQGIQNFLKRGIASQSMEITFDCNLSSRRFDENIEVILYRVICELVNNSIKHSGCSAISISLNLDGGNIHLEYSDNGRGFNPQAMLDCGMGLSNISSRINSLNGSINISSEDGKGMNASITVSTGDGNRQ